MNGPDPTIRVGVDLTNPGQFFACCGLLELADRLRGDAEGWFEGREFLIRGGGELSDLVREASRASLAPLDPDDSTATPIQIGEPFRSLRLDWWRDDRAGGKD